VPLLRGNQQKKRIKTSMNAILKTTLASVLFLGASSLASAQSEPAQVATLKKAEGTVMVDKGKGFVTSKVNAPRSFSRTAAEPS
jgi:hypothetical protein